MITLEDLIKAGKNQVRSNSDLMIAYKEVFKEKFGREPICAGCTFNNDWNRLTNTQNTLKTEIMSDKTFQLKDNSIIYSYDELDGKTKIKHRKRSYGNRMSEEFAIAYLTVGTKEEIEERKKQFKKLPSKFSTETNDKDVYPEKLADLKIYAKDKGYAEDEYKEITNKKDMIAYLDGKAIESEEMEK